MNPTKSPHSRASEVWARLVGLFGGETVAKKFGDEPPAEWVGVIAQLTDYQLERGMRRLLASGKGQVPSLPEFRRMCVEISNDDLDPPRAVGLIAEPAYPGDAWDMAANRHLLAYIARRLAENPKRYGRGASRAAMQVKESKNGDASPEFIANVGRLVVYKNAWAQDMRDEAVNGEVLVERQKLTWSQCMERAETEIAKAASEGYSGRF